MSNQEPSPPLGFGAQVGSDPRAPRAVNSKEIFERMTWYGIHAISVTTVRTCGHVATRP